MQQETPERILDTAERLFMENGYEGTSMRMVTTGAEVNLAAVNYHFGSKEGLLQAVFRRRLVWLNTERVRLLDELEAKAGGAPLRPSQVLEGFFGTLLAIGEDETLGGMTFLKLLGRTMTEPADFIRAFFAEEYAEVVERYKEALYRALPDVPRIEIAWRFNFMLGAMSYAIAGTDALAVIGRMEIDDRENDRAAALALRQRLIPFLLGGLRAPMAEIESPAGEISADMKTATARQAA